MYTGIHDMPRAQTWIAMTSRLDLGPSHTTTRKETD
jgi:hypothetical protein